MAVAEYNWKEGVTRSVWPSREEAYRAHVSSHLVIYAEFGE